MSPTLSGRQADSCSGAFVLCKYHIHTLHSESRLAICHTCSVGLSSSVSITDGDGASAMCSAPFLHTRACGDLRREFLSLACLLASYHNNNNKTTPYFKAIFFLLFYCCPHAEKGQGIISRTRLTIPRQWDIQTSPSLSCSKLFQEFNP